LLPSLPPRSRRAFSAAGVALSGLYRGLHRPVEWTGASLYDSQPTISGFNYSADLGGGPMHAAEEIITLPRYNWDEAPWVVTVEFNCNPPNQLASRWQNRHYRQDVTHVGSGYGSGNTFKVQ
jgi:hypothetical protein